MSLESSAPVWVPALVREFGEQVVSLDVEERATYARDWTKGFEANAAAVARPRSAGEVAQVVRFCAQAGIPIVPSGGRTGLAGGACATSGELVLSLERLRRLDAVDRLGGTVRVEAGVVTQTLHDHVADAGLLWPIDLASKGSSQIGGNIATNAGGVRVIRYGHTRHWVLGLEVVTARGETLVLGGALEKNNTGPDLRQLFIGSEGILGVVTAATLKLTEPPGPQDVLVLAASDMNAVLELFQQFRDGPGVVSAFEYWGHSCMVRLQRHRGQAAPFDRDYPFYVLVEVEPRQTESGTYHAWLESLLEQGLAEDAVLAQDGSQRRRLWEYREGISESLSATGYPHKNDVALPVAQLPKFTSELAELFESQLPDGEICLFGHIGDGNIHINTMKPGPQSAEAFLEQTRVMDRRLFELVQRHGGSISAEHGIGLLKKPYLHYSRSPAELELFRQLKTALDPSGILNPGKIFDP